MPNLTDLNKKLLEVREIQSKLNSKKNRLINEQRELDRQLQELHQKQSEVDKLISQTHQKELELQRQIELTQSQSIDQFAASASKQLQNELLTLLSGNGLVAARLINHQQTVNPGKSANWYLEKVIYDLKRDRH